MAAELGVLLQASWSLILLITASSLALESNGSFGNNEATIAEPPALVENLGVTAVEHSAGARGLQLYVNWTPPTEGPLPKAYFLRVKSINESSEYCGTMDFDEDINSTVTWQLVPPEVSAVEHDPRVLHECAYNVRVESRPYGGRRAAELNYTVPELVGSSWSCRQSAALPLPRNLRVSVFDDAAVDVSWEVDAADVPAVQGFSLRLGTEIVSPLEDWFEFGPEVLVFAGNWSGGGSGVHVYQHRLQGGVGRPLRFLVQARVLDRRGCRGPPAEASFHGAGYGSPSLSQTLLVVVLPVLLLVLAAAAVAALVCRGRGCWEAVCGGRRQRQPAQPWLQGYSTVVTPHSGNGLSSLSDVTTHPVTDIQVSYESDIELLGIKTRCDDM